MPRLHLSFAFFALALPLRAATLPLEGRVRELGGRQSLAGAQVEAVGLSVSALSGTDGAYRLALPLGWLRLRVSAPAFEAQTLDLTLSAQTRALPDVYLRQVAFLAQPVQVRARRIQAPSRTVLQRQEIRRIAGIGRDPLRALQALPGVISASDFSGQLAVRGGGPQDNAYFLNDVPWPVPFHYGGAISTVHSDLLESVDLYAAAFPARWGGVDGAILDATSRAPKRDGLHGQIDLNLLLAEGLVEGPLGGGGGAAATASARMDGDGGLQAHHEDLALPMAGGSQPAALSAPAGAISVSETAGADAARLALAGGAAAPRKPWGSFLLSGRRSYFELLLGSLGSRFTAVPRFWDLSLLADADLGPKDKLRFTGLATDDLLALDLSADDVQSKDFVGEFRFQNSFSSAGLNWVHQGDGWRNTLTPYGYEVRFDQSFGQGYGVSLHPGYLGIRDDAVVDLGDHELGIGAEAQHLRYDVFGYFFRRSSGGGSGLGTLSDPAGLTISADASVGAGYLRDRIRLARGLRLELGGRWQRADRMVSESWDPRASLEWVPAERTRLSAGWGLYSQFPTPRELSDDFGNPQLGFNRTEHVVAGVEQGLGPMATLKVEAYYKTYRDLVVEVPSDDLFANDGEGFARGVELLLRRESGERWFGWLSYSYAESWRLQKGGDWQRYRYDQPHTLTLVGSYDLTPAWSAGAKLNWHSGILITPIIGRVPDPDPSNLGGYQPVYGDPYSQRLADYLRLDLRTDYAFRFRGWRLNLYAEVLNVLGRANPAGVTYQRDLSDYASPQTVDNLPRLPYIGLGAEF